MQQRSTDAPNPLNIPSESNTHDESNRNCDLLIHRIITRCYSKKKRKHLESADQYRVIDKKTAFDFIEPGSSDEYHLSLRFLRFEIADGVFENVVTNLPNSFDIEEIKWLYNLRWGIETTFRDTKKSSVYHDLRSSIPVRRFFNRHFVVFIAFMVFVCTPLVIIDSLTK